MDTLEERFDHLNRALRSTVETPLRSPVRSPVLRVGVRPAIVAAATVVLVGGVVVAKVRRPTGARSAGAPPPADTGRVGQTGATDPSVAAADPTANESAPSAPTAGLRARTGRQAQGGEAGNGELIRLDAPDAASVVQQIASGVPFPGGASAANVIERVLSTGGETSEGSIRSTVEFIAACRWTEAWLTAHVAGDNAGMEAAQAMLNRVPDWPALKAADGGGVTAAWQVLAEFTRRGDKSSIENDSIYSGSCS